MKILSLGPNDSFILGISSKVSLPVDPLQLFLYPMYSIVLNPEYFSHENIRVGSRLELKRKKGVKIRYLVGHDLLTCDQYLGTLRYPCNFLIKYEVNYAPHNKTKTRPCKVTLREWKNTQTSRTDNHIIHSKEKLYHPEVWEELWGQERKHRKR